MYSICFKKKLYKHCLIIFLESKPDRAQAWGGWAFTRKGPRPRAR